MKNADSWSKASCHEYAAENFNSSKMASNYIELYEKVLAGEFLNKECPVAKEDPNIPLPWII